MKTINIELTRAEILKKKNELLKKHAEIFKEARDLEFCYITLNTIPAFRDQNNTDVEFIEGKYKEIKKESLLVFDTQD